MRNPHEYNDAAYLEASNELQGNLPEILDKLWQAGASINNIQEELTATFGNCMEDGLTSQHLIVTISQH